MAFYQTVAPQIASRIEVLDGSSVEVPFGLQPGLPYRMALVPVGTTVSEFILAQKLARELAAVRPDLELVYLGRSIDDAALMSSGNCLVTGAIADDELTRVLDQYRIGRAFMLSAVALFDDRLARLIFSCGIPVAKCGWSRDGNRSQFVILDPGMPVADIASFLDRWCSQGSDKT